MQNKRIAVIIDASTQSVVKKMISADDSYDFIRKELGTEYAEKQPVLTSGIDLWFDEDDIYKFNKTIFVMSNKRPFFMCGGKAILMKDNGSGPIGFSSIKEINSKLNSVKLKFEFDD